MPSSTTAAEAANNRLRMLRELAAAPYRERGESKRKFHSIGHKFLQALADAFRLPKSSYEVRSCLGGPAVMGEVVLHSEEMYVEIYQPAFRRVLGVMVRQCDGRKDYVGRRNHQRYEPKSFEAVVELVRSVTQRPLDE